MNGDSIFLNFLSKSHRTGQWCSPNLHLTQMPLIIGHGGVDKQRGVRHLHAALSWKCFRGLRRAAAWDTGFQGKRSPQWLLGGERTHQHSDNHGTKSKVKYSQFGYNVTYMSLNITAPCKVMQKTNKQTKNTGLRG